MSASEPSLPTSLVEQPGHSLLDSLAAVATARRTLSGGGPGPHGSNAHQHRTSHAHSLVRLALANNPNQLLSAAQSYPSLTASSVPTSSTLTTTQTMANVMSLSQLLRLQALTRSVTSTSSESDNDFLETYRAHTLLAELEDDEEELPDPDTDHQNEDDDDLDHVMEDEELEPRDRRAWDDEFVLKRQFSALIPAFDPRPGRTNVPQTQDFDIPAPGTEEPSGMPVVGGPANPAPQPRLCLTLRAPCLPGMGEEELVLWPASGCVFRFVQELLARGQPQGRQDRLKRIWEPTYTVLYREAKEDEIIEKESDIPSKWLGLGSLSELEPAGRPANGASVECLLLLLRRLHTIATQEAPAQPCNDLDEELLNIPAEEFVSKKITNKLTQQIQEPLVLASGGLPAWCDLLTRGCPTLFPATTRQLFFSCTAFGTSRSIVWLQTKREQAGGAVPRPRGREDGSEFRLGRLKHERVVVPRGDALLDWARQLMRLHATRKAVLEIEFKDEEGTGLGPTLEFYALVAGSLQRKALGMWLCDDDLGPQKELDLGQGSKPVGYYVQRACGLFPAPLPQDSPEAARVEGLFHFLGVVLAKCLQDNRLMDLPLSRPFLKLLVAGGGGGLPSEPSPRPSPRLSPAPLTPPTGLEGSWHSEAGDLPPIMASIEEVEKEMKLHDPDRPKQRDAGVAWFAGCLTEEDFAVLWPGRAVFLRQLRELAQRKQRILRDRRLTDDQKNLQLAELTLPQDPAHPAHPPLRLEDLGLTFVFDPSSRVHKFSGHPLRAGGAAEEVTLDTVEDYVDLLHDFCLHTGIRRQMDAFLAGFNSVFPLSKLRLFSPEELSSLLCGDQAPSWTMEDILNYTEPKLGYTRESPGFLRLARVLCRLTAEQRKAFLQFTTGCSSLPPGGLKNLHPRLTIVRKVDGSDGSYPSVNTCVHYLKLPDYSSEEILRERLLTATREKGFHLN